MDENYEQPFPRYNSQNASSGFTPNWSEDNFFKLQYSRIDFENKSFKFLKRKLASLNIPPELIIDLIDELSILVNNASKMKLDRAEIGWFLDEFDKVWHNYCIYTLNNSRWISELNHMRAYAELVFLQELHKSIEGWQGDNLLHAISEQRQKYDVKQENYQTEKKRGFFRNRTETSRTASQPVNIQQQR
jgi:hypothetical protein